MSVVHARALTDAPARWSRVAAHLAALTPLPSALWRLSLVFGASGGFTAAGLEESGVGTVAGRIAVIFLSVATELAGFLTVGLVSQWGEFVPQWVPRWGGRRLDHRVVVALAGIGVAILIAVWTPMAFWWTVDHPDMTARGNVLVGLAYLPLVAWGPLLAAVTLAYWRRHVPAGSAKPAERRS